MKPCYCGEQTDDCSTLSEVTNLLECSKCGQRIHSYCVQAVKIPILLYGDKYFTYYCKDCSKTSTDSFERHSVSWSVLLQLVLYYLHVSRPACNYFHIKDIYQILDSGWEYLRAQTDRPAKWKSNVAGVISTTPTIFKSGVKDMGRVGYWTLVEIKLPNQKAQRNAMQSLSSTPTAKSASVNRRPFSGSPLESGISSDTAAGQSALRFLGSLLKGGSLSHGLLPLGSTPTQRELELASSMLQSVANQNLRNIKNKPVSSDSSGSSDSSDLEDDSNVSDSLQNNANTKASSSLNALSQLNSAPTQSNPEEFASFPGSLLPNFFSNLQSIIASAILPGSSSTPLFAATNRVSPQQQAMASTLFEKNGIDGFKSDSIQHGTPLSSPLTFGNNLSSSDNSVDLSFQSNNSDSGMIVSGSADTSGILKIESKASVGAPDDTMLKNSPDQSTSLSTKKHKPLQKPFTKPIDTVTQEDGSDSTRKIKSLTRQIKKAVDTTMSDAPINGESTVNNTNTVQSRHLALRLSESVTEQSDQLRTPSIKKTKMAHRVSKKLANQVMDDFECATAASAFKVEEADTVGEKTGMINMDDTKRKAEESSPSMIKKPKVAHSVSKKLGNMQMVDSDHDFENSECSAEELGQTNLSSALSCNKDLKPPGSYSTEFQATSLSNPSKNSANRLIQKPAARPKYRLLSVANEFQLRSQLDMVSNLSNPLYQFRRKLIMRSQRRLQNHKVFNLDAWMARYFQQTPGGATPLVFPSQLRVRIQMPNGMWESIAMPDEDPATVLERFNVAKDISKTLYSKSLRSYILGNPMLRDTLTVFGKRHSAYTGKVLEPYIIRNYSINPPKKMLLEAITFCEKAVLPNVSASIDLVYFHEMHVNAVNDMLSRVFWPGIDMSESLTYPDFSIVALYKRLVIGCAFMNPEGYITYLAVLPGWQGCGIASMMLYQLIKKAKAACHDICLHVSASNKAMLLYQKFGFKSEGFFVGFYSNYFPKDSKECPNAIFLRLRIR
ncbi:hypothetical protein BDV3_006845 [Batrachochytrium dendrobatidis]